MKLISQIELSKKIKISRQAINKAIKNEQLKPIGKKIDLEDALTIDYIKNNNCQRSTKNGHSKSNKKVVKQKIIKKKIKVDNRKNTKIVNQSKKVKGPEKKVGKKTKHKYSTGMKKLLVDPEHVSKTTADKMKIAEQIKSLQIKNEKERMELIERDLIVKVFAKLYAVDVNELRQFGNKMAADIAAVCEVDKDEIILEVRSTIDNEMFKILRHIKRIMNDFLKNMKSDELD